MTDIFFRERIRFVNKIYKNKNTYKFEGAMRPGKMPETGQVIGSLARAPGARRKV